METPEQTATVEVPSDEHEAEIRDNAKDRDRVQVFFDASNSSMMGGWT